MSPEERSAASIEARIWRGHFKENPDQIKATPALAILHRMVHYVDYLEKGGTQPYKPQGFWSKLFSVQPPYRR